MQLIEDHGVKKDEMYKTFNMGIGFCVIAQKNEIKSIKEIFHKHKLQSYEIGKIINKVGVFVNSKKIA
jgi:phosphoribosylformylglycinamidine cyclo-ligase